MKTKNALALCALFALFNGCITAMPTSSGRPINTEFVDSIEKGKTTMAQVRAALGEPASTSTSPDAVIWSYMHWEGKPSVIGATYSKSTTRTLTVQFKNGKVADYTFSTTKAGEAR
jgi:outer membrane protein assembly factor BamE (lipoprotein component of BamABCDE complex)